MSKFSKSTRGTIVPSRLRGLVQKRIKIQQHRIARQSKAIGLTFLFVILLKVYHSQYVQITKIRSASVAYNDNHTNTKTCALLFFGLIKDSFQTITLPSIQEHILAHNPQCDIFLHTYNLTTVPLNKRNAEVSVQTVNISQAYLLTNNVMIEDMDSFNEKRIAILDQTRKFYHRGWGDCCVSHDNMIKQWNSIQGVWDLMQHYEQSKRKSGKSKHSKFYDQVGLFRSDVYYTKRINIFDSQGAIPDFGHYGGYNDRLFYGSYENAEVWASKRFEFTNTFEEKYMFPSDQSELGHWSKLKRFLGYEIHDGYHSETFLKKLMNHYQIYVEAKNHCVWRVRTGSKIQASDCDGMKDFSSFRKVRSYSPKKKRYGDSWSLVIGVTKK
jgi:hypothetical protein